jgi:hypothetical protein
MAFGPRPCTPNYLSFVNVARPIGHICRSRRYSKGFTGISCLFTP